MPEAVQVVLTDSASAVMPALERAISDEGIPVRTTDRGRQYVESVPIDVGSLKTLASTSALSDAERMVTFRFFVRTDLGATRVFGEAVYQPAGTDLRAMQRMVPDGHPARQVLARMLDNAQRQLTDR